MTPFGWRSLRKQYRCPEHPLSIFSWTFCCLQDKCLSFLISNHLPQELLKIHYKTIVIDNISERNVISPHGQWRLASRLYLLSTCQDIKKDFQLAWKAWDLSVASKSHTNQVPRPHPVANSHSQSEQETDAAVWWKSKLGLFIRQACRCPHPHPGRTWQAVSRRHV